MNGDWLPVLVVLGVGALLGLAIAWRLAGRSSSAASSTSPDDALRLADLELRRDDLLARLRRSDNEADRRVLEDQAARVLRDIDQLGGGVSPEAKAAPTSPDHPPAVSQGSPGRPMLVGFLGGAAMISLVSVLIFLALRDAEPDRTGGMAAPAPAPMAAEGEHPTPTLSAETQARLDTLRQRVEADPTDLVAQKQLALALLSTEQFFEAFQVSEAILEGRPDDPDGLYVHGMVRMTMGQDEMALELLDRVLDQYPNHILALAGRGMVFLRSGDREAAVLVWERALEAAGGSHPDLEQLLAMARGGVGAGNAAGPASTGAPSLAGPSDPVASPSAAAAGPSSTGELVPGDQPPAADSFGVRIELAAGAVVPRGATLFVFLREGKEGPPSAVRRFQNPIFPLQVDLGPNDTMLGRPLPEAGMISARLDADGSASTRGEGDLLTEVAARLGERVALVLGE